MKTIFAAFLSIALVVAVSCNSNSNQNKTHEDSPTSSMEQQVSGSLQNYFALKDALVESNSDDASAAAGNLEKALTQDGKSPELIAIAADIAASSDLEKQREHFKSLSEQWIASLKKSEKSIGVYVQYCPMAFDDAGASWISLSDEILNPYFGDQMLYCGSVEEQL